MYMNKEKIVARKHLTNIEYEMILDYNKSSIYRFAVQVPLQHKNKDIVMKKRKSDRLVNYEFNLIYKKNKLVQIDLLFAMKYFNRKEVRYYLKELWKSNKNGK